MKPVDYFRGNDTCIFCGGSISISGIPVFGCNHRNSEDDGCAYTNKCTQDDWKVCGNNKNRKPEVNNESR